MTRQNFVFFTLVGVASFLSLANCQLVIGCIEGDDTRQYRFLHLFIYLRSNYLGFVKSNEHQYLAILFCY